MTEKYSPTEIYSSPFGHFLNMCEPIFIFAYIFFLLYFGLHGIFKCSFSFQLNLLRYNCSNSFNVTEFFNLIISNLKYAIQCIEYLDRSE